MNVTEKISALINLQQVLQKMLSNVVKSQIDI